MQIPWHGDRCILCLEKAQFSEEHIIPDSLGGLLTCSFLCQKCNSSLGATFESNAKKDPSVRIALQHLESLFPALAIKLHEGQEFVSNGPGGIAVGRVRKGEFTVKARTDDDGTLTQQTKHARNTIIKKLKKAGCSEGPIQEAIDRFDSTPENQKVSLGAGIEAVKWSLDTIEPDLSKSQLMSPLVPLKTAFEFLACHLGTAIYDNSKPLSDIRHVLTECIESHPSFTVERLSSSEYKPMHGLVFEGNDPYAKVQLRLFGWLAFRVHFHNLAIGGPRFIYTHHLDSGVEDVAIIGSVCEQP